MSDHLARPNQAPGCHCVDQQAFYYSREESKNGCPSGKGTSGTRHSLCNKFGDTKRGVGATGTTFLSSPCPESDRLHTCPILTSEIKSRLAQGIKQTHFYQAAQTSIVAAVSTPQRAQLRPVKPYLTEVIPKPELLLVLPDPKGLSEQQANRESETEVHEDREMGTKPHDRPSSIRAKRMLIGPAAD
ncbi:uncharacterized protein UDID_17262 [Ustilago sp. UG-2017a]|nr:uncharacterized protein UDID_17262 [Ustilago sp. UG-2017a]